MMMMSMIDRRRFDFNHYDGMPRVGVTIERRLPDCFDFYYCDCMTWLGSTIETRLMAASTSTTAIALRGMAERSASIAFFDIAGGFGHSLLRSSSELEHAAHTMTRWCASCFL